MVKMHENGSDKADLDAFLATVDDKRLANFRACSSRAQEVDGPEELFVWVGGPGATWTHGLLVVKVNPELILRINGTVHIVKLHYGEEVSKRRVDTMLHLVESTVPSSTDATVARSSSAPRRRRPSSYGTFRSGGLDGEVDALDQPFARLLDDLDVIEREVLA